MSEQLSTQILLAVLSIVAMFCSQSPTRSRLPKYACLFGLLSQPFWFYSSIVADQYGVVVVNLFVTFCWLRGLWFFWLKRQHGGTITLITDIKRTA